jgi:CelD/BcsL family acetyltransferase involved in cellulose biosynthesis
MLLTDAAYAAPLWETVRKSGLYDFADIRTIDAGTPCGKALAAFATLRASESVFHLNVKWPNGESWLASRPRNKRSEYKRRLRRLEEKGPIEYHIFTTEAPPQSVAKEMVDYKVEWCRQNGKHGLFDLPDVGRHVGYLLESTLRNGTLYFTWLTCGNTNIAYEMGVIYRNVLYVYIVSNDPAWSAFSPGNLLKTKTMGWAMDQGIREINTMQGSNQSKLQYTPEIKKCADYTFSTSLSGHVKETLFVASRRLWQKMKKLKSQKPAQLSGGHAEEMPDKEAA